jgi:hypothetical protein
MQGEKTKQCDQVFSGEITTSGFINYYIFVGERGGGGGGGEGKKNFSGHKFIRRTTS